jgi:DNA-binding transcriptional regulator YdaS (Cro superfamily)
MDLKMYLADQERGGATRFAESLGVSISYLSQMAAGSAPISPARCVEIERATDGAVTRKDLRPDDWESIWPELAKAAA